jgi:hypothetical protein
VRKRPAYAPPVKPSRSSSQASRSAAARPTTVPGPKMALTPASQRGSWSCGGITPPHHDHDVLPAQPGEFGDQLRHQGQVPGGSEETPTMCTSFSTAWRAVSPGVWKSGPMSTSKPRSAKGVGNLFHRGPGSLLDITENNFSILEYPAPDGYPNPR